MHKFHKSTGGGKSLFLSPGCWLFCPLRGMCRMFRCCPARGRRGWTPPPFMLFWRRSLFPTPRLSWWVRRATFPSAKAFTFMSPPRRSQARPPFSEEPSNGLKLKPPSFYSLVKVNDNENRFSCYFERHSRKGFGHCYANDR